MKDENGNAENGGKSMKRIGLVFLSLTFAFFGFSSAAIAQTVKVGAVVPLTGRYAAGGAQNKAGYEIAVEQLNAAGGVSVGGKKLKLELVLLDDESDPTKTVARLETLANQGVVAYFGGFGSDLHAAAASIADKNKIPYLGVAFAFHGIHKQGLRYLFSPFPKSPDLTKETFVFLDASIPAAQRPTKVALVLERTDWGKEMGSLWEGQAKQRDYQVVASGASEIIQSPGRPDRRAILCLRSDPGRRNCSRPRARPGQDPRRHRGDKHDHRGWARALPAGWDRRGEGLFPAMAQRKTGTGLA